MFNQIGFIAKLVLTVAVICVLAVAATVAQGAQDGKGSIVGTVTTESGQPVEEAMVVAFHVRTARTYEGFTDAKGHYTIKGIPLGSYDITVTANGFEEYESDDFDVTTEEPVRQDVKLTEE